MALDVLPFSGPEHQPFEIGDGRSGGVLLIHGFPGSPAEVRRIGETLAAHGWHSRGILLPGFGADIPNLNLRRREDWLRAAQSAWDELRRSYQPAVVLGYSMGGAVALNLTASSQDRLVLAAPFWRMPGLVPVLLPIIRRVMPNLRPFKKANFGDPRLRQQFDRILPGVDLDDPQVRQTIQEEFILPLRAMEEVIRMGHRAYRHADRVSARALVIQGAQDPLVRPQETRRLVQRLPAGRTTYHEIDAGHELLSGGGLVEAQTGRLILDYLHGRTA
jgi:carboxylesterase